MSESNNLEAIALRIRGELVKISNQANTPHLGSSLSCVDILVAAYWGALNIDPTGRFLYVAGESSGRIASYMVNQSDGTLDPIEIYDVGKLPMWVLTILL